jgi:phospholipase A-2-activating protein
VCSLTRGLAQKSLISGSWDQTARIWTQVDGIRSSTTLEGHEAAVWAVTTIGTDKYATGSADKNVFIWNSKGEKVIVLKGHTDCVRGLLVLNNMLLSCSNDASIRVWSCDSWELIKELHGHSNYIYTIAANKVLGDDVFLTGSEDSTIRMWSVSGGPLGVLEVPAQSVWSITCLANSDIVTGTSDALIRIFTASPDRVVDASIKGAFDLAVETRKMESSKTLGGIAVKE